MEHITSTFPLEIDSSEIHKIQTIGNGTFGKVDKARWKGKTVAIKYIQRGQEMFNRQVRSLSKLKHANVVDFYGANTQLPDVFLVMEFARRGTLRDRLYGIPQRPYTPDQGLSWARQCAEGLAYLHSRSPRPVVHGDIKPENLLLFEDGLLKVGDFGLVRDLGTMMVPLAGTIAYAAPEVLLSQTYSEKSDVFSWTTILWEVFARERPYRKYPDMNALAVDIYQGLRPSLPRDCPDSVKQMIVVGWKQNPWRRPTMQQIVDQIKGLYQSSKQHYDSPLNLQMYQCRLDSYENWPLTFVSRRALAGAGFYYLKTSDCVQCYWCRLVLCKWTSGENPYIKHQMHSPLCPFVLRGFH